MRVIRTSRSWRPSVVCEGRSGTSSSWCDRIRSPRRGRPCRALLTTILDDPFTAISGLPSRADFPGAHCRTLVSLAPGVRGPRSPRSGPNRSTFGPRSAEVGMESDRCRPQSARHRPSLALFRPNLGGIERKTSRLQPSLGHLGRRKETCSGTLTTQHRMCDPQSCAGNSTRSQGWCQRRGWGRQ